VRYAFAGFTLDPERFALRRGDEIVHVEPQVFDVLAYLVEQRDRVVKKTELLDAIWGDRFVSESALTSRIKAARKAVGDDGTAQTVIRTVHGRGYQFVAEVSPEPSPTDSSPSSPAESPTPVAQDIRFCTTVDGVRLAYAQTGHGPPLVRAAHWMTHIDYDVQSPVWRHWVTDLSAHHTFVRYDERGCGLSDHDVEFSFEAWIEDLEAVVDAAGLERFALLGVSQGGAVSVAYAARHPERVSHLVLLNSYLRGRLVRARDDAERREAELQASMAVVGWGRDDVAYRHFFASQFLPGGTPEIWDAFAELQRRTTSAENAHRFMSTYARIDVTEVARTIDVPTLVLHARYDRRVPFSEAREAAAVIRNSRLVSLDTANHLFLPDEPAWATACREIDAFVTG
jgi:pimeloyl-ACP methyl ester carboxylesterase/DNA-binding winged helix-turn-helix (wHTH) protein